MPRKSSRKSKKKPIEDPARGLDELRLEGLENWKVYDPDYAKHNSKTSETKPIFVSTPNKPEGLFKAIENSTPMDEKLAWQQDLERRAGIAIDEAVKRTLSNSTFLADILRPVVKQLVESETEELEKIINNHAYILGSIVNKDMIESINKIERLSK